MAAVQTMISAKTKPIDGNRPYERKWSHEVNEACRSLTNYQT